MHSKSFLAVAVVSMAIGATLMAAPSVAHDRRSMQTTFLRVAQADDRYPYAYCWATRAIDGDKKRTYYFSRVWGMESDGPTIGFQPEFNSYVDARYSNKGGTSAQCLRFFGRSEAERQMNNLAADARRNGNQVVFTNWRWWD